MESEFSEISPEDGFLDYFIDMCEIYKGVVIAKKFKVIADLIENFEVRDDDIWICTFPRSGTTWTQEMIWNIVNDLDFEGAQVPVAVRMPFFESATDANRVFLSDENKLEKIKNMAKLRSPRIFKTHLHFDFLPRELREHKKNCKIIHVSRNPKDVCISYYHYFEMTCGHCSTLEDFSKAFLENKVLHAPYWTHENGFYQRKDNGNILFIKYEDMKQNLPLVIRKAANFLDKELNQQQIKELTNHLSFAKMQKNPAVNREKDLGATCENKRSCEEKFIRKGEVGQWKTRMSQELIDRFDQWILANSKQF